MSDAAISASIFTDQSLKIDTTHLGVVLLSLLFSTAY